MKETLSITEDNKSEKRSSVKSAKDYWLLMKPELTLLSVFTALCSAYLAIQQSVEINIYTLPLLVLGTLLVGGGSGALNQSIEHEYDALMKRTSKRPIPTLRITPKEGIIFGIVMSLIGTSVLLLINWLCAFIAISTLLTYVFLYTPLKRISQLATVIGAIPGALPTLIGWTAIQNSLSIESLTLFAIVFYWQMPHFYSIGWMYRLDYAKAGFKLLTTVDEKGTRVAGHVVVNSIILMLIGTSPGFVGLVNVEYVPIAFIVGAIFLYYSVSFARSMASGQSAEAARKLFFASLVYIPVVFSAMILFKITE